MGTWHQCVVDRDAVESEVERLAATIVEWLVEEGIVEKKLENCVLGSGLGHRPGRSFLKATEFLEDRTVGNCNYDSFSKEVVNGLEISTKRSLSVNNQGDFEGAVCPACGKKTPQNRDWSTAVNGMKVVARES